MSVEARGGRGRIVAWVLAAAGVSILFLLPIVAMFSGSLRPQGLPPPRSVELIPADPSLGAYRTAFSIVPLARSVLNSAVVAVISAPIAVLAASWGGFALAHLGGRARRRALIFLLLVLMVPVSAVWLTRFGMFKAAGLTDTYAPLIAPAVMGGSPLFVLLFWLAFRRIPADIVSAARLEGAGAWRVWRAVAMPLVRSTTIAVGLLAFALSWASFIDPLLYLNSQELYTAPLVLRSLEQLGQTNWPVILAGAAVITVPVAVAFAVAFHFIVPRKGAGWLGG
jgi:ABC-type glycerol-3-phosphate transport system permease component